MPDLFDLIAKWWKLVLGVLVFSIVIAFVSTWLKPKKYLSITTAIPASTTLSDKGAIFNENIEGLYSAFGSPDDVDRIVGTAELDTVYLAVTDQLNLRTAFELEDDAAGRTKAAQMIKQNSKVYKSGHGDLRIKTWDKDPVRAADIANAIMDKLSSIYGELQSRTNQQTLQQLIKAKAALNLSADQLSQYDKLITEYQIMEANKAPALLIVEKARPAIKPDRPRMMTSLLIAAFAAILFSIFLALVLEKKNRTRRDGLTTP